MGARFPEFMFWQAGRVARRAPFLFLALMGLLQALVLPASAHNIFSSWTDAHVRDDGITLELTVSRVSALQLIVGGSAFSPLTPENFAQAAPRLKEVVGDLFTLSVGEEVLPLVSSDVKIAGEDDVMFILRYPRPSGGRLHFYGGYVEYLIDGHVGTLVVNSAPEKNLGWSPISWDQPSFELPLPPLAGEPQPATPPEVVSPPFTTFLRLGIHHILIGYDHLLFLFGLIIACHRFRPMITIITCFTIAHSITLGLAAFDVVTLSPRIVEPLIAASIVYVGVENLVLRGREPQRRWLLTFAFGLIHGFGFAGALKEVGGGLVGRALAMPLFSFNLGVELGQIAVAAVCLPILILLRRHPRFERYGPPVVSALVALAGGYWLLERTVFS